MTSILQYAKSHKFLITILVALVGGVGYYFTRPPAAPNYETTTVKKGTVKQEVSLTGKVESDSVVSLVFERGGRVVSVPVPVGKRVKRGDTLVRLDTKEVEALRSQARANLDFEMANLALLKSGTRSEDIAVTEAQVRSAESAVTDAHVSLQDKLSSASTITNDAIFNKTDYLFDNPRTINPRAIFPVADQQLVSKIEQERAKLSLTLKQFTLVEIDLEGGITMYKEYFNDVKKYLDDLASAVNAIMPSSQFSQTTIDGWKANVSLARVNTSGAISALLSSEQAYRAADAALVIAKYQLALKKAGATPEAVSAEEAKIRGVNATIANYDAQMSKSVIIAPFSGVVTKQDAKLGETVAPNAPLVALMSDGIFKITANVPEVDVAKLSVGDTAKVTLDAYGIDVLFRATVTSIDPAETVIEGVSTYGATLRFDENDTRIRSGMTANIDILTDKRENALYVPARAVFTREEKKYVKVPSGPTLTADTEITTGLRGSDGSIEILIGLTEGQTVVTFQAK